MKVSEAMRFPHPVLWSRTQDYLSGAFDVSFQISESLNTGQLDVNYSVVLDEPAILQLVQARRALVGIFLICPETYHTELMELAPEAGRFSVAPGRLKGRVVIRPVIWCTERVGNFRSSSLHEEFGRDPLEFPAGSVLALGDEYVIHVGRDKIARMESIFSLVKDDSVPENQFGVLLDGDKVQIVAAPQTFERIHHIRGTPHGRALLLNSVYLPVIMEILAALRSDSEQYEGRRWHRVFTAKAAHLGLDVEDGDLLDNAQRILSSPFAKIAKGFDWRSA